MPRQLKPTLLSLVACVACASPPSPRGAAAPATPPPASRPPAPLVGVWRVVRFCDDDDSTGLLSDPWGPAPIGYFVYAAKGTLSIQVMRAPSVAPFARGDAHPSSSEREQLFQSYFGYFVTYTITSDSTVVHHVSGGTAPSFVGTDQLRLYQVRGDTLTIGGSRRTWPCRLLLRVGT